MTVPGRVAFLGTGTSHGVPIIGCRCAVCTSDDPRDTRTRPSILITGPAGQVLVDTSPDFRQQALRHGIDRLDAVLYTHSHADHIMGFDDLRRFNHIQGAPVPCYASEETWSDMRQTFHYVFANKPRTGGGIPEIVAHVIDGPLAAGGMRIVPVPLWHGQMRVLGFRTGAFAYLTDCNRLDDAAWPLLAGLDTLVLDALRDKPHSTHFTVRQALEVVDRIAPRCAYFTHMTHDVGHRETSARLPPGVQLAYDGLVIDVAVAPE